MTMSFSNQVSGRFEVAMRRLARQALWWVMTYLLAAAAAQGQPDYSNSSVSVCIPFTNPSPRQPFAEPPMLSVSVEGSQAMTMIMDTGSVGIAIAYDQIPNFQRLKTAPGARPGYQFLSSSKILWRGTWVPVAVTFYDGHAPVATAKVPVLGVEQEVVCPNYSGDGTCGKIPPHSAKSRAIAYMGVGFGREEDHQPQGTPDKNPLLNLAIIAGRPVTTATFSNGYTIGVTGVTVGLTRENAHGFRFIKLARYTRYPGDWVPASMCVRVNDSSCFPGSVLVDTGISQSYMTVPLTAKYRTVEDRDPSEPSRPVRVLMRGTKVEVNLPGALNPAVVDGFIVGDGTSVEPDKVILVQSDKGKTFVNTGRHFLRKYQLLYDATHGYVGLKPQTGGCGG